MYEFSIQISDDEYQGLVKALSAYNRNLPDNLKINLPEAFMQKIVGDACTQYASMFDTTTIEGVQNQKAALEHELLTASHEVDRLQQEKDDLATKLLDYEAPKNINGVPEWVYSAQAYKALILAGMMPTVKAALEAMPGVAGEVARVDFEKSARFYRNHATIQAFVQAGLFTNEQLDQLFIAASHIA